MATLKNVLYSRLPKFAATALCLAICVLASACEQKTERPSAVKPNLAEEAIDQARQIVSDPSNWKSNTALLTDLGGLAQDLGVTETPEFKEFDVAAQELIRFGTTWISSLDDGSKTRLRTELSHLTTKTEASLQAQVPLAPGAIPTGAGAEARSQTVSDTGEVQSDAERVIFSTVHGLRAAQADEFGKLFARAQTAYRSLRRVLQTRVR